MEDMNSTIKIMQKDIDNISKALEKNSLEHEKIMKCLDEFIEKSDARYITKEQYANDIKPIKSVVYGMVGFVLLAFLAAVTAIVIKQ